MYELRAGSAFLEVSLSVVQFVYTLKIVFFLLENIIHFSLIIFMAIFLPQSIIKLPIF